MGNNDLSARLKEINIMESEKLDSISNEIIINSQSAPSELINILRSKDREDSKKAAIIIQSIGNLSLTPLMESLDKNNPENYAWEMEVILSLHLKNRLRIVREMNSMLLDKRDLKGQKLEGKVEEKPPKRRICDDAYLMLRKLLALQEDEEELMTNERMFLEMSNSERDKEIDRWRSSKEWISLCEKMLDEDDF